MIKRGPNCCLIIYMQNLHSTSSSPKPRIGLIQSRGIGDIIIALPIARWYHDLGFDVYWPIDQNFMPSFRHSINYVKFIPFKFQHTLAGFYSKPLELLYEQKCTKIINLYSYLSGLPVNKKLYSESLTFDQYKYAISEVPFEEKWKLSITRNHKNENDLFVKLVKQENYIVIHNTGSNISTKIEIPSKFKNHQIIYIEPATDCIFDWIKILEKSKLLIMIDSCYSNLAEQLQINTDKIFILRSKAQFTPVLKSNWLRDKIHINEHKNSQ
jgi:hypothetical protein